MITLVVSANTAPPTIDPPTILPAPVAVVSASSITFNWDNYQVPDSANLYIYLIAFGSSEEKCTNFCGSAVTNSVTINLQEGVCEIYMKYKAVLINKDGQPVYSQPSLAGCAEVGVSTSIEDRVVDDYQIIQNYPNPFNPITTIAYQVANPGNVQLIIYNQLGQEVSILVNEFQPAGNYNVVWNASNQTSGYYFYHLDVNGKSIQGKMLLLK
jgi:hypothetical protein